MPAPSRFISVEIAIKTNGDCDAFVDWFRAQDNYVEKIPCDTHRWYVYFAPLPSGSADMTIRSICEEIPGWPEVVRRQWDDASFREFFVGYEIGTEPIAHLDHFDSSTLGLAAGFGAGIGLALYPTTMGSSSEEEQTLLTGSDDDISEFVDCDRCMVIDWRDRTSGLQIRGPGAVVGPA